MFDLKKEAPLFVGTLWVMVLLNHMSKDSQTKVIDNFFVTKDFLQAIILMDLFSRFIVLQKGPFIRERILFEIY